MESFSGAKRFWTEGLLREEHQFLNVRSGQFTQYSKIQALSHWFQSHLSPSLNMNKDTKNRTSSQSNVKRNSVNDRRSALKLGFLWKRIVTERRLLLAFSLFVHRALEYKLFVHIHPADHPAALSVFRPLAFNRSGAAETYSVVKVFAVYLQK